jgi:hypothetical protein
VSSSSQPLGPYRPALAIAAAYDIILGLAFILQHKRILKLLSIEAPKNSSYIHLSAVFVLVQGISYVFAYLRPGGNEDLLKVGMIYKLAYAVVSFYYFAINQLLHWAFLLFGIIDLGFLAMFAGMLRRLKSAPDEEAPA